MLYIQCFKLLKIKIFKMQKNDKLFELKTLLWRLEDLGSRKRDIQLEGQIIEILKSITYFRGEAEIYGMEVLSFYIHIIEGYMLRAGMQVIDQNEEYAVIQGIVRGRKNNGELGNVYSAGMLLDPSLQKSKPQSQRQSFTCTQQMDTKMIKIFRNSKQSKYSKYSQNLGKYQKQKLARSRQIQRTINSDIVYQNMRQKAKKFQFFQKMGSFDLNQLIVQSKTILLSRGSTLHQHGSQVTKLGFILSGQIKIDSSAVREKQKQFQAGKRIIQKYMIHKRENTASVMSFASPGQWVGLEQYFWKQNFLSRAQVFSHDAQILYVPVEVFAAKFNQMTNYHLMNKIKGLIETKKKLFDKAIKTKQNKQILNQQQKQKSLALQKLKERLKKNSIQTANSTEKQEKSNYFSFRRKSPKASESKNSTMQTIFPKKCYMPQRLVHKVKVFQQKYQSLPKIQQRFVLFPEQYQKASIPLDLKQKLRIMKKSRNQGQSKPQKLFKIMSNQKIYERVIFQSLSPKNQNPEVSRSTRLQKNRSKKSIDVSQFNSTYKDGTIQTIDDNSSSRKFRFNNSIFNNFRAPRNQGQRLLDNLYKTLEII